MIRQSYYLYQSEIFVSLSTYTLGIMIRQSYYLYQSERFVSLATYTIGIMIRQSTIYIKVKDLFHWLRIP